MDTPMTLAEHLAELRGRLIKIVSMVAVGMIFGFVVAERVQGYFLALIARIAPQAEVISTTAPEKIIVYFTIAFYLGIAFAMPIIVYQAVRFLAPGLTPTERR